VLYENATKFYFKTAGLMDKTLAYEVEDSGNRQAYLLHLSLFISRMRSRDELFLECSLKGLFN
jgi:hypothetical protein